MKKHLLVGAVILTISLLIISGRFALSSISASAVHTVCASGCSFETILEAINEALPTDTIQLLDPVHIESGIFVSKTLSIEGSSPDATVLKAAESPGTAADRLFFVDAPVSLTIKNMTISNGRTLGSFGGGIWNEGSLTLSGVIMRDNQAGAHGGAIYTTGPTAIISSTLFNNSAGSFGGGGGIAVENNSLTIENSTIDHNVAGYGGGILFSEGTQLTIRNSTISSNESVGLDFQYDGGGALNIYTLKSNPQVEIQFSTLVDNSAKIPGRSGVWIEGGELTFLAAILDHSGGSCYLSGGSIVSEGYNLESTDSCGFNAATDQKDTEPILLPLSANGGPSPTHGLNNGSPALNVIPSVKCTLTTDQRGTSRPIGGGCEAGSFEANPPAAAFLASPTAGSGPLAVSFSNYSIGEFTECDWDFGDGRLGKGCASTIHSYDRPGIFTVKLSVSGPSGSDTYTRANYIIVGSSTYLPSITR